MNDKLYEIFTWKSLDFAFPNQYVRDQAIKNGQFNPGGPFPLDVDIYYGTTAIYDKNCQIIAKIILYYISSY